MSLKPLTFPGPVPEEGGSIFGHGRHGTITPRPDYRIDPATGCWEWQKATLNGYGMASSHGRAHRVYYQLANGPVPKGTHIHHECKNTRCVNPAHLEVIQTRAHHLKHFMDERGYSLEFIEQVRAEGRKRGARVLDVAERYGLDHMTVQRWWWGKSWADLLDGPVVTPGLICQADNCDNECAGNRHKQYCSPKCKFRMARARDTARKRAARASSPKTKEQA